MAEIDSLEIKLQANAQKANTAIDSLITKLGNLATSLGRVNGSELSTLSMNVTNLSASMKAINDVGTASFTRLAKNIGQIAGVDSSALNTVASSLNSTASAFNQFTAVSENAAQIGEVAKNIAKLGNKSVQTSITNMPQLATSLTNLLTTLASAPTVSNNVIQMTNALANLASQGSKVGSASRTIQRSLNGVHRSAQTATKSTWSLAKAFGKFYASYFLVIRGAKGLWKSIESTTNYIEAFNYYAVAFGKIGSEWGKDFERFGYDNATDYANSFSERVSALLGKLSGLQVDVEGGLLTADGAKNLGLNIQEVTEFASQLASVTNSLGQTGETTTAVAKSMTMLAGDISSLFNIDYTSVATNIQSGLIGQSRALYKYGIDITNATLQTYAYNLGVEKSISEMTQMEKQQLRVLAILDQSKVSWGDLSNTINSPSNMIRQFNTNIKETGMVLGQIFIPVLQKFMPVVNGTTIAIKRLLVSFATLMGIKIDFDAFGQSGYQDTADGLEDIADGYDDVAEAADKAKKGVRGFDELNVISTGSDTSTSGADGSTVDLTDEIVKATEEYENAWNKAFENMENESSKFADKVSGFFEKLLKPLDTWGSKIEWSKIENGLEGIWDFAKSFTKGVGDGFLNFVEGLADIGAPIINGIADAVEILFNALNLVPVPVWQTLGGALGGVLTALLGYKAFSSIAGGVNNAIGGFADLLLKMSGIKLVSLGDNIGKLGSAIGGIGTGGKVMLAAVAISAVAGAIIELKQAYENGIEDFVNASVFDGEGTPISDIADQVSNLLEITGTSSSDIETFTTGLQNIQTELSNARDEVKLYATELETTGTVSDDRIGDMQTAVGNLATALKNELKYNSDLAWGAFMKLSGETATQLGIDVGTMTTILSQFNQRFNGIYNDMESEANAIFDKMLSGEATEADYARLNELVNDMTYLSDEAINRQIEFQQNMKELTDINFVNEEETQKAIENIAATGKARLTEIDNYYEKQLTEISKMTEKTRRALKIGQIIPEEAEVYFGLSDKASKAIQANWDDEKETLTGQINTTFDFIQAQMEKAGLEVYQDAVNKPLSVGDIFFGKHPEEEAVKMFDEKIIKPSMNAINSAKSELGIRMSGTGKSLWGQFKEAIADEANNTNYLYDIAHDTTTQLADAILGNADKTRDAFVSLADNDAMGYGTGMETGASKYISPRLDSIHNDTKRTFSKFKEEAIGLSEGATKSYGSGLGIGNSRYIAPKLDAISISLTDCFDMANEAESAGENTAKGFETGLSKIGSSIATTASNLASGVVKIFQTALDIHSPSRVMFELGAYTTEDFKDGMESLYEATQLSAKDFGFGVVEAVHPQQLYSDYMSSTPTVSPMASTTTQNYYNSNTSVDNAETNALLREQNQLLQRILAKEYGITKDDIGKASREYARDYFRRTGREAYTF